LESDFGIYILENLTQQEVLQNNHMMMMWGSDSEDMIGKIGWHGSSMVSFMESCQGGQEFKFLILKPLIHSWLKLRQFLKHPNNDIMPNTSVMISAKIYNLKCHPRPVGNMKSSSLPLNRKEFNANITQSQRWRMICWSIIACFHPFISFLLYVTICDMSPGIYLARHTGVEGFPHPSTHIYVSDLGKSYIFFLSCFVSFLSLL
jgi:hypothetical protein